ncbi:Geranylgeranyl pyrophosphate synthase/Polyprenyl synthetase [Ceraceosorus bombacis]|uniref:(2E,6E)-farnesyl diphosphate synthase n=1 Tax=Ceraceosorus bombacis TaxID=401625 RepID=A0A0P1BPX1_9BASI|nr:Geranylgeranyl pyrophosphate synthase/Polyprenyl synthetase [Ceraceosorus bombacis]
MSVPSRLANSAAHATSAIRHGQLNVCKGGSTPSTSRATLSTAAGDRMSIGSRCGSLITCRDRTRPLLVPARRRNQSGWASVVDTAKNLVSSSPSPTSPSQSPQTHATGSSALSPPPNKSSAHAPPQGSTSSSTSGPRPTFQDPLDLVRRELSSLRANVSTLLGSGHPALDTIAKYYFQAEGKHIRPLIVLLMARATNGLSPKWGELVLKAHSQRDSLRSLSAGGEGVEIEHSMGIDEPLSPREVLNDFNPHMESVEGGGADRSGATAAESHTAPSFDAPQAPDSKSELHRLAVESNTSILPTQRRLAEITEMIHVASLLHDDVIDASSLRRGEPSAPAAFGNKLSILGGDFLLGRASVALARLRDNEVVELLATVIANLVEGEVMQLRAQALDDHANGAARPSKSIFSTFWEGKASSQPAAAAAASHGGPSPQVFEHYLQKTYLKTAALIGKSARAATILGGSGADAVRGLGEEAENSARAVRDAAYTYGRNVGIAFQLVDDLLDFKSTSSAFGKPSGGADLRLGLATAPVLYAWEEMPNEGMGEMVRRKFEGEGDVERALSIFPPSEARDALESLNQSVLTRVK